MNSRHSEKRKNAWKEVEKSRIDRETLERPSGIREKKRQMRSDEECLLDTYSTQNEIKNEKAMKLNDK